MGYSTDFSGQFNLDKPLTPEHKAYLEAFNGSRRMQRNSWKTAKMPDPLREAVELPVGTDGGYFVGAVLLDGQTDGASSWANCSGQAHTPDILDYNRAPKGQPGLWCQWTPNEDGTAIEWDGGEKFYKYVDWIEYLIENFLAPWGYVLNGEVNWEGEDSDDLGLIVIENNEVSTKIGRVIYE